MEPLPFPVLQEPFVDAERAANFLAMSRKTLLAKSRNGRLPGHPIGDGPRKIWRFRLSELSRWLEQETLKLDSHRGRNPEDWVFASARAGGKMPPWADTLLDRILQPSAKKAGIEKWVGFHIFRHTYSTLLKANNEDVKVVQELMRHANITTTMNIYTKALTPAKREAQSRVVDVLIDRSRNVVEGAAESAA